MRMFEHMSRIGGRRLAPVFMTGLVLGVIIVNMGKSILLDETGLFSREVLYRMKYITVDSNALFCFALRKRLLFFGTVAVLATTYMGLAVCFMAVIWCGMSAGVFLTVLLIRYGIKGLVVAVVCVFPQMFFYFFAFLLLFSWSERLCRAISCRNCDGQWREEITAKRMLRSFVGALVLTVLGCWMEGYVNPGLFLGYLKIF